MNIDLMIDAIVHIPDPARPLYDCGGSQFGIIWSPTGSWNVTPAGTYDISVAAVDEYNRIGPWSQPTTLTVQDGWTLIGYLGDMPWYRHQAAWVWRLSSIVGQTIWLVEAQRGGDYSPFGEGLSPVETQSPYPWSSNNKRPYLLTTHARGNFAKPIETSTLLQSSPPAPKVYAVSHRTDVASEFAWAWATHSGMSRLSPSINYSAVPTTGLGGGPVPSTMVGFKRFKFVDADNPNGEELPCGVLGKYLFQKVNGSWRMVPIAPWYPEGPDRYLYQPQDNMPMVWMDANDTCPLHVPPVDGHQAWCVASPLQQAMYSLDNDIHGTTPARTYGPVIDPCLPSVVNRSVRSAGGGALGIKPIHVVPTLCEFHVPANNHPTYWPVIVESCNVMTKTAWNIFFVLPANASAKIAEQWREPGPSIGVTARDYSGGQAFGASFDGTINLGDESVWPWIKMGFHVGWECAKNPGEHTASEWVFGDVTVGGNIPVRLEGTQTVNMRFKSLKPLGFPCGPIILDGSHAIIENAIEANHNTLFSLGWNAVLECFNNFCDQGSGSFIDFNSYQHLSVYAGNVKCAGLDFVYRAPVIRDPASLFVGFTSAKTNNFNSAYIGYSGTFGKITIGNLDGSVLRNVMTIVQPTIVEQHSRLS